MTTELTKAAQQALEQLEFLNACYPHKTAADAIASLQSALTQRPAAQTEREAFEAEMRCEETWGHRSLKKRPDGRYQNWQVDVMWDAWQARASLPAPQQATPEPDSDGEAFRTAARLGLTLRFYGGCAQSGMPGSPSAYEVVSAGGDPAAAMREAVERASAVIQAGGEAQKIATPEPVGEVVAYREKLTGRLCEPEDTHRRKFPMCYEPLTRPAPGVPEGWRNVIAGTLKTDPWDSARVADYNSGWNDCQRKTLIGLERLAAAQAKGAGQ